MATKKKTAPKAKMAPMGAPMQQPQPFAKDGKFRAGSKGGKKK